MSDFESEYKRLNKAQKEAVDTIEGPVMVVAGPGTGKTQVLALRIANILKKTDVGPDGILCLTFTNVGAEAMRERLRMYIGKSAARVEIHTFHAFGMRLIEEFYAYLGFDTAPRLIDDLEAVSLADEILHTHDWNYIRSRANTALYFFDLKSLVSVLKRERITPSQFLKEIEKEIDFLKNDSESISTRGPSKGKLKQEVVKKIEGLERTLEIVTFYELYEALKIERGLLDYDDVLENSVKLVETSEEVRDTIRERYLYILVDEHQDSTGVQNEFLAKVWSEVEQPNIFVVGDDRQLIYGFGGASISYFEGFKKMFEGVKVFTLIENYRSTQIILDSADALLTSTITKGKLVSQKKEEHKIQLLECDYPRDEIIAAGLAMKEKIEQGINPNDCALLVPKNKEVKSAIRILLDLGLPVAAVDSLKLFELPEIASLLGVLEGLLRPETPAYVAPLLLDPLSKIPPLAAHEFLVKEDSRKITLAKMLESQPTLFSSKNEIKMWAETMNTWLTLSQKKDVYSLLQHIGEELLILPAADHRDLTRRVEAIRTLLHLVLSQTERNPKLSLADFISFVRRLETYSTDIPLAVFGSDEGIKVLTLHGSKGLEFDFVWIAHMDEKNLEGKTHTTFALPEAIKERLEEKDEFATKRKLYVAMTRAKRFCTLSYAQKNYSGADQRLATIIEDLPQELFERKTIAESEQLIKEKDMTAYVVGKKGEDVPVTITELAEMVKETYTKRKVSVTMLNNFFECTWKWYFRNMLMLPEPEVISLQFGNVIHSSIEKILKQHLTPTGKDLDVLIAKEIERLHGLDEIEEKRIAKEAKGVLGEWVKKRLPEILSEYESEKFFSYRDPEVVHLEIGGKIDLMEKLDDLSFRVTDFKTGKVRTKNEIEKENEEGRMSDYLRQLAMYSYLLAGATGEVKKVEESRLEFVEAKPDDKNAIYMTHISSDHIERLRDDIKEYDRLLKSGKWIERPCHFKGFKNQSECEYCKLAERIYGKK